MPQAKTRHSKTNRPAALYVGASIAAAWDEVLLPWFKRASRCALTDPRPACVVVPHRAAAQQLRARLARETVSLLGVQFFVPAQLRDFLQGPRRSPVFLREHFRLLLAAAAEETAARLAKEGKTDPFRVAQSIARDSDELLRSVDNLAAAGASPEALSSPVLAEIAMRFTKILKKCGGTLVPETDRQLLHSAQQAEPRMADLLISGFDATHWPLWPLLHSAALASEKATVLLREWREEAAELDRTWTSTWEEHFGATTIAGASNEGEPRFSALLTLPESATEITQCKASPARDVHFLLGHDSTEQARAVVALATGFLNDPACDRLAILLPGPGALARLVASGLERQDVPHNDGVAHPMRAIFDTEEWRRWLDFQQQPRLGPLLRFLDRSPAAVAFFVPLSLRKIKDTLQRACGDILINAIDVLREYCGSRARDPVHATMATGLGKMRLLPEHGQFAAFIQETLAIFDAQGWSDRSAELKRRASHWSEAFLTDLPRGQFLRWLTETFTDSSLHRDPHGAHPYARVQLLRYDQAEGEAWSHVIFAGLNEGVWPGRTDESPFLPDDQVEELNRRNTQPSTRFGEGQQFVRAGHALCLPSGARRSIALRQLLNVIESTTHGIGVSADLYTHDPREQAINPSEFYARLFFGARGEALSQTEIARLHEQTEHGMAQPDRSDSIVSDDANLKQTAQAYRARRTDKPFGQYEFAFREESPPARKISLSATDLGNSLKRPALVWMKAFLGVQVDELNGGSWNLATGQWVHRWLASIGAEPRENRFVARPAAGEIEPRIKLAADAFRREVESFLQARARALPDWWLSGWFHARHLAAQFAGQLDSLQDWPSLAAEWVLDSSQAIRIGSDEIRVRGRVDLILANAQDAAEIWIVDYKTGEAKPLRPHARDLRKQLAEGDGVQICIYALALRTNATSVMASLLTRDGELVPQIKLEDIMAQQEIWQELARMQRTGIFGMKGELRSEFAFTGTYPLATLAIDKDLLRIKWERTHPAFAKPARS